MGEPVLGEASLQCADSVGHIGDGYGSTTLAPNIYPAVHDNPADRARVDIIDLPGELEQFTIMKMINALTQQAVVAHLSQAKIVLVATFNSFRNGTFGAIVQESLSSVGRFFAPLTVPQVLAQHVILVITHAPRDPLPRNPLNEILIWCGRQPPSELKQPVIDLFTNGKVALFTKPAQDVAIGAVYTPPGHLHDQLERIQTAIAQARFRPVQLSIMEQDGIRSDAGTMMKIIKKTAEGGLRSIFASVLYSQWSDYPDIPSLKGFVDALHRMAPTRLEGGVVVSAAPRTTLAQFLADFNNNPLFQPVIPRPELTRLITEMDLLGTFLPRADDMQENWTERVLQGSMQQLQDTADALLLNSSKLLLSPQWDDTAKELTFIGHTLRLTTVMGRVDQQRDVHHVRLFAIDTVIVDMDVVKPGLSFTIIAQHWTVELAKGTTRRVINLAGEDGAAPAISTAAATVAGVPGLPGTSGGHFVGLALNCQVAALDIDVRGGTGGDGQNGGPGVNGASADHATVPEWKKLLDRSVGWAPVSGRDQEELVDQEYHIGAQNGTSGTAGGAGGKGGNNGAEGSCQLVCLVPPPAVLAIPRTDKKVLATDGTPGSDGTGGTNGNYVVGTWHRRNDTRDHICDKNGHGWNGVEAHWVRQGPSRGRAANGITDKALNTSGIQDAPAAKERPLLAVSLQDYYLAFAASKLTRACVAGLYRSAMSRLDILSTKPVDDLLAVFFHLEQRWETLANKTRFVPCYESLSQLIERLAKANLANPVKPRLSDTDNILLLLLHTSVLSRLSQLRAAREETLVVNLGGLLKSIKEQILQYRTLDTQILVNGYHAEYSQRLERRVHEADDRLLLLARDMQAVSAAVNVQIDAMLVEIRDMVADLRGREAELQLKRERLKQLLARKTLLAFLTIGVQCVGMMFGPYGVAIAAVVNVGVNIALNPGTMNAAQVAATLAPVVEATALAAAQMAAQQPATPAAGPGCTMGSPPPGAIALSQALSRFIVEGAVLAQRVAAAFQQIDAGADPLAELDQAIMKTQQQIVQLVQFQGLVDGPFRQLVAWMTDQLRAQLGTYAGQSIIGLQFARFQSRQVFEQMQRQIAVFSAHLKSGETLLALFGRIHSALDTSISIYEQVEHIKDQIALATYMLQLSSPVVSSTVATFTEQQQSRWHQLRRTVHRNVILEQYTVAVQAARMWWFPFAEIYLGDGKMLSDFVDRAGRVAAETGPSAKWIDAYLEYVVGRVDALHLLVQQQSNQISGKDNVIRNHVFEPPLAPFFQWSSADSPALRQKITQLFEAPQQDQPGQDADSGNRVALLADAESAPVRESAIKFSTIDLRVIASDPAIHQQLTTTLENSFCISLVHSGRSYYRAQNSIYSLGGDGYGSWNILHSFGLKASGSPLHETETANRIRREKAILSPFTHWIVQLSVLPGLGTASALKLRQHMWELVQQQLRQPGGRITLSLEGTGTFVDLREFQAQADQYEMDAAAMRYDITQAQRVAPAAAANVNLALRMNAQYEGGA